MTTINTKLRPTVCGVGYLGVGAYVSHNKKVASAKYTKWKSMIERCYSENVQKKHHAYIGCSVCDGWHNFQNFAKWFDDNYPKDGLSYVLDKDIKIKGNRLYSPDTCLFVSSFSNNSESSTRALSMSWCFLSPKGVTVNLKNLRKFCRDNNLDAGNMAKVHSGQRKSHKNWRVPLSQR